MNDSLRERLDRADLLWAQGDVEFEQKHFQLAYALYTQAHDLIMDCAAYHRKGHQKLIRVTAKTGRYGEHLTDWLLLHVFHYLGIFQLVSYLQNRSSFYSDLCKHHR